MILAIDIGNSNITLGCIDNDRILFEARMATDLIKTSDQYCAELKNMLELFRTNIPRSRAPLFLPWCRRCSTPSARPLPSCWERGAA